MHDDVVVSRHFDHSAKRVFDAWLDPAIAARFLFATETGTMVQVDIDPRASGRFAIVEDRPDMGPTRHEGEYLEMDRPSRLVFAFAVPQYDPTYTTVTLDIAAAGEGCDLTLIHEGVEAQWRAKTAEGWKRTLEALDRALA